MIMLGARLVDLDVLVLDSSQHTNHIVQINSVHCIDAVHLAQHQVSWTMDDV